MFCSLAWGRFGVSDLAVATSTMSLPSWLGSRGRLDCQACLAPRRLASRRNEMEDYGGHDACPNGDDCARPLIRENAKGDQR
jgi:hypothetical protein